MKKYFTISEFAKLRDININSLRYYEKIGVLKPARTDSNSGYRYYTADQLALLDTILLCINVGIPLKELPMYIDNGEFIQNRQLFETSRKVAQQRIRDIQTGLDKIEYTLRYLNANRQYCDRTDLYERPIIERTFTAMDYIGELRDIRKIETSSAELYNYAQGKQLSPVFPAGLLIQFHQEEIKTKIFFEIVSADIQDKSVIKIPEGNYMCRQIDLTPQTDLIDVIKSTFKVCSETEIIVSNMFLDKFQLCSRRSELQKAVFRE